MDELRHAAEPKLDIRAEESKPEAEEAKPEVEEPKPEAEVAPTEGGGGMAVVQPLGAAATAPTPAEDVPPAVVPVPTGLESASEPAESEPDVNKPKDYAELMAEELAKPLPYELEQNPAAASAPEVPGGPEVNHVPEMDYGSGEDKAPEMAAPSGESYVVGKPQTVIQPINTIAPDGGPSVVATSGGGDIGGAPMAGSVVPITANEAAGSATPTEGQVLPPPPPPPPPQPGMMMPGVPAGEVQLPQVAEGQAAAESTQQDVQIPEAQPVLQDQVYPQQANDPGAFKIPGT